MGRQREVGGRCGKKSRLGEEGLECRRNLGKEEVWKAGGEEERGKWGRIGGGGQASRGERTGGTAGGEKSRLNPASEEAGDYEERGWGLHESAAAFSIHPDSKDSWPLRDLEGREQTPGLCGKREPQQENGAVLG